jgi:hypothetical protein
MRRDLTVDQKAQILCAFMGVFEAEKARQRKKAAGLEAGRGRPKQLTLNSAQPFRAPEAAQVIAAKIGISRDKVRQARKVHEGSPELAEQVKAGKLPLKEAVRALPGEAPKKRRPISFRSLSEARHSRFER